MCQIRLGVSERDNKMNSNVPISAAPSPSPSGEAAKKLTQAVYEALSPNPNHNVLESWELLDSFLPRSVAERLMQREKEIRANVGAAGGVSLRLIIGFPLHETS